MIDLETKSLPLPRSMRSNAAKMRLSGMRVLRACKESSDTGLVAIQRTGMLITRVDIRGTPGLKEIMVHSRIL